jgi:ATP-binding cassette subfamily B protein
MLSREFDGVDLSGGQWQRVALARGFYRDHKLIVLDEPTAAIDPLEETKIYKQFMEIARDKTAVIITHRMGSAKLADRIVVMDNGRIDDIGTHEELMRRGGLYYEMFTAQSVWYDREAAVI